MHMILVLITSGLPYLWPVDCPSVETESVVIRQFLSEEVDHSELHFELLGQVSIDNAGWLRS